MRQSVKAINEIIQTASIARPKHIRSANSISGQDSKDSHSPRTGVPDHVLTKEPGYGSTEKVMHPFQKKNRHKKYSLAERLKNIRKIEPTTVLHLFRALLRQSSYLPDPASRRFFQAHLASRFRDYCPRKKTSHSPVKDATLEGDGTKEGRDISEEVVWEAKHTAKRHITMLAQARKELQFLHKANLGWPVPLQKVLDLTYGRRGKRKYDLLKDLLPPTSTPANHEDLEKLSLAISSGANDPAMRPKPPLYSEKFVALVRSQMKQKRDTFIKPVPKSAAPRVPETNSWGRPMPKARVKNIVRKWYAETLDRLLPPLPASEWRHLGDLAVGKINWPGRPKPRAKGTGLWDEKVSTPSTSETELLGKGHELTPRYMRRMWASLFAQCPLMQWNAERKKWDVQWGQADKAKEVVLSMKGQIDSPFNGVDEAGKIAKA